MNIIKDQNYNKKKNVIFLEEAILLKEEVEDNLHTFFFEIPIVKKEKNIIFLENESKKNELSYEVIHLKKSFFDKVENHFEINIEILCNSKIEHILIDDDFKELKLRKFFLRNSGIKSLKFLLEEENCLNSDIEEILLNDNKIETSGKEIKQVYEKYKKIKKFDLSNSINNFKRNFIKGNFSKDEFQSSFIFKNCIESELQIEEPIINRKNFLFLLKLKKETFQNCSNNNISDIISDDINFLKEQDYLLKKFEDQNLDRQNKYFFFNKNIYIFSFLFFIILTIFNFIKISKLKKKIKKIQEEKDKLNTFFH